MNIEFHNPLYHKTVLPREVAQNIITKPGGVYVDATFGGGGHTKEILKADPTARVIAVDWDKNALEKNKELLGADQERVTFLWINFIALEKTLREKKLGLVDGIIADFGTSQEQLMRGEGFSFSTDTPLDMRMSKEHQKITAAGIVNRASEKELEHIFFTYGEERHARIIAKTIVEQRAKKYIQTTGDLVSVITSVIWVKRGQIHPATRVFQALRIVVNHELEHIEQLLESAARIVKPGGRLLCISFHSLEDRIVKQFARSHKELWNMHRDLIVPTEEEVHQNASSRSARMRVLERKS